MSVNVVTISGNLTRDPDFHMGQNGNAGILSLSVAVNDRRQNKQTGQWENVPNYVDCTVFGNRAISLAQILHKGMKVAISGKLHMNTWQDKNTGKNRSKLEVIVNECEFMETRNQQPQQPQQPQLTPQQGYYQ